MPFGEYIDFEDCLAQNADKDNPEGYCAELHKVITGDYPAAASKSQAVEIVSYILGRLPENKDITLKQVEYIIGAWGAWAGSHGECVSSLSGKPGITDPEALCAWLHQEAEGKWPGEKSAAKSKETELGGPIVVKDKKRRIVVGPVLVPGEADSDGEILTAEKIEEVAYNFLERSRYIDKSHTLERSGVPVSSDVLRFAEKHEVDGQALELPAGTWMLGAKIYDEATWQEVEKGNFKGFSIMGVKPEDAAEFYAASKGTTTADGAGGFRKILLSDLGEDWEAVAVSILDDPAVPKSQFIAIKSESAGWLDKILARFGIDKQADISTKQNQEVDKMELEEIKTLIAEAIKEMLPTIADEVKALISAEAEPVDEAPKSEEAPPEEPAAPEAEPEAAPAEEENKELDEIKAELEAVKSTNAKVLEKLDELTAVKSNRVKAGNFAPAKDADPYPRDIYGRRVNRR